MSVVEVPAWSRSDESSSASWTQAFSLYSHTTEGEQRARVRERQRALSPVSSHKVPNHITRVSLLT